MRAGVSGSRVGACRGPAAGLRFNNELTRLGYTPGKIPYAKSMHPDLCGFAWRKPGWSGELEGTCPALRLGKG